MALTFNTGRTLVNNADSATDWAAVRWAGTGGAPSASLDTTVFKEGSGAVASKMAGNNWNSGLLYDWYASAVTKTANTTVNLQTTGNEIVGMWIQMTTPSTMLTLAAGGLYLTLSSSTDSGTTAPTVYSEWWLYGSATYPGGWVYVMVDTRKTPSATVGGGCALGSVRRIGIGIRSVASVGNVKADNLFIDFVSFKRPRYQVVGDGSTVADWTSFFNDSDSLKNGLVESVGGIYFASCGFRFGSSTQGATTTFTANSGRQIVFKRYTYHNATSVVDAVTYSDVYLIDANGVSEFKTAVQFGTVVGTGDDRQGVLGGGIRLGDTTNMTWAMDFATNIANLSGVKIYGLDISGAKGGILLDDSTKTSVISCGIVNCGELVSGTIGNGSEMLSCAVIDPFGGTNNRGLRTPSVHNIKKISLITSGSPTTQHLTHLSTAGTYGVAYDALKFFGDYSSGTLWHGEASANNSGTITVNATNSANPTAAEFESTGTPTQTVAVNNPIVLIVEIRDADGALITDTCEVTIVRNSDTVTLFNDETVTTGSTTYNYNTGGGTVTYINILNITGYQPKTVNNYTLPSSGTTTLTVQLDTDPFYNNP